MNKESRYSLQVSNKFIYQWLVFVLLFNLGIFTIIYFGITPLFDSTSNPDFYSKLTWAIFTISMFFLFATIFIIANGPRYWIDMNYLEIWSVYRTKKRTLIEYNEIIDIKIRRTPLIASAFNFGTLVMYKNDKKTGRKKVAARLIGVEYPNDVYLDLINKCKIEIKDTKLII
ncbi:MAG: hypothetical protein JXA54_15995 [Candidatus Heimdallarchaeota archaeon]|nr:hypothetical protein [Candidatus Heimdallarchaeota archaeon]